jgi:xanthine dehydrogenase accessory factor
MNALMSWHAAIAECTRTHTPYVLATIVETSGSTPRDQGGKMIVTTDQTADTIGGGQFEQLVIDAARQMLSSNHNQQQIKHFPLAAAAAQCCGGSVTVLLESFGLNMVNVVIFGAGHVGQRICTLLEELPVHTSVVDARKDWLQAASADQHISGEPTDFAQRIQAGSIVLILTHDHLLDYQLISILLKRNDLPYLGLIGSKTKWLNFSKRLRRDGFSEEQLARVTSPIGLPGLPGKSPMAVAISVVAQLLRDHVNQPLLVADTKSKTWREMWHT